MASNPTPVKNDFRFDYKKYKTKAIDVSMLDKLMEDCISAGTSRWASIVMGIKIVLFFAYLWARKTLIDQQMMIEKQNYEMDRVNQNETDIGNDDLDKGL